MKAYNRIEKLFVTIAMAGLFCSVYFLSTNKLWEKPTDTRRDISLGNVNMTSGDTRWKGVAQAHQFKIWQKQKLYAGDTLYAGAASRLSFYFGEIHVDLKPHTRVTLRPGEEKPVLDAFFGQFEVHLPPGERLRVNLEKKFLDLASVNGGRVNIQVESDHTLRVQNLAGDLVVRTETRTEYTVPEEEIFRASGR